MNRNLFFGTGLGAALIAYFAAAFLALPISNAAPVSIKGNWKGGGVVKLKSGSRERIQCNVTYGRSGGQNFSLSAKCASGSGAFRQTGNLTRVSKTRYVGTVFNSQYNVSGRVVINVKGSRQTVFLSNKEGTARLSLRRR